jgi:hypothetical protein
MADTRITTLLKNNVTPLFTNMYDVEVSYSASGSPSVGTFSAPNASLNINYQAKSINLSEGITLTTEYIEANRQNFLLKASIPKAGTIVFHETYNLDCYTALKTKWFDNIYNFIGNYWEPVSPLGTITITLGLDNYKGTDSPAGKKFGKKVTLEDVIPTSLVMPSTFSWEGGSKTGDTTFSFTFSRLTIGGAET